MYQPFGQGAINQVSPRGTGAIAKRSTISDVLGEVLLQSTEQLLTKLAKKKQTKLSKWPCWSTILLHQPSAEGISLLCDFEGDLWIIYDHLCTYGTEPMMGFKRSHISPRKRTKHRCLETGAFQSSGVLPPLVSPNPPEGLPTKHMPLKGGIGLKQSETTVPVFW